MKNKVLNFEAEKIGIEVYIGGELFFFPTDDVSLAKLTEKQQSIMEEVEEIAKKAEEIDGEDSVALLEYGKEVIRIPFELYFGEGSFKRFYELMPSIIRAEQLFNQVEDELIKELAEIMKKRAENSGIAKEQLLKKKAKKRKK